MPNGTMSIVEKTTVYLDADLRRELQVLARRTGRPQAELIRQALAEYVGRQAKPSLPSFIGAFAVGGDAGQDKRRYREQWRRELARKGDS
jgi:hypothetical protein